VARSEDARGELEARVARSEDARGELEARVARSVKMLKECLFEIKSFDFIS
jgi:protein-arginine kinase